MASIWLIFVCLYALTVLVGFISALITAITTDTLTDELATMIALRSRRSK